MSPRAVEALTVLVVLVLAVAVLVAVGRGDALPPLSHHGPATPGATPTPGPIGGLTP